MTSQVEKRLAEAGLTLPKPNPPVASYVPYTRSGSLVFISGQIPLDEAGKPVVGRLGADVAIEDGQRHARTCALSVLAHLRNALDGDLDRVTGVLKVGVFVNATADFTAHPQVGNGASELFVLAFGDAGRHARAAVGVASLPAGVPVEVDAIFEVAG
ncbi:MAG: RidA family protein [Pseudomonadales bacterium]